MSKSYRPWTQDRAYLLPPSLREWLPEDHLAWFILGVVSQLDLGPIESALQSKDAAASSGLEENRTDELLSSLSTAASRTIADRDEVLDTIERYRLAELAVVDVDGRLLGVIRPVVLLVTAARAGSGAPGRSTAPSRQVCGP